MALRLALVIEGDSKGAKQAVDDTTAAVEKLDKAVGSAAKGTEATAGAIARAGDAASSAAPSIGDVSVNLAKTDGDGRAAARGIGAAADAANKAAGGFNLLNVAAVGVGSFLGSVTGNLLAGAISAAAGAAADFVREILSSTPRIERDLRSHEELIDRIGGAYKRAQGAASDYGRDSQAALTFAAQQDIRRLASDLESTLGDIDPVIRNLSPGQLGPFADEVARLREDMQDGVADVIAFRDEIAEIGAALPEGSRFRDTADGLFELTTRASEVQSELNRAIDLFRGLTGDSEAAARALGGSAEKMKLTGDAAAAALPFLREYADLIAQIGGAAPLDGGFTPIPEGNFTPRPFAAGGVVNAPTLFRFGAGRTGLMGEAGPEAILPLAGGAVGAKGAGGREHRLGLTRLASGNLGVELPHAFAAGGVVGGITRFQTGGIAPPFIFTPDDGDGGIGGLAEEADILRGAFRDLASSVIHGTSVIDALRGAAQRLADRLLDFALDLAEDALFGSRGSGGGLLGALLGGLGGLLGGTAGPVAAGGVYHSGGIVGTTPVPLRRVPLAAALSAPRYHDGLMPGERIGIFQDGETIVPRGGRGGGGTVNNFYVETPDPRAFAEDRASLVRGGARIMAQARRFT